MKLKITYETPFPVCVFRWTPRPYLQPLHTHNSLEIGCCLQGGGQFYFGEKQYSVRPGDVFVVNRFEPHIAQSGRDKPDVYLFLNFDPEILRQEGLELLLPFAYRSDLFDNRISAETDTAVRIRSLMEKLYEEWTARLDGYVTMCKSLLLQLCVELKRYRLANATREDLSHMAGGLRRLQPALDLFSAKYAEPIDLKDVARELGIQPASAARLFLRITGQGWRNHLTEHRMREAKRLLTATDLPVAEIGYRSGFQSLPTFYRLFQSYVGVTPLEYRSSI